VPATARASNEAAEQKIVFDDFRILLAIESVLHQGKELSAYAPDTRRRSRSARVADFSLVEVVIEEPSGAIASYKKLSSYRALQDLSRYREGVSADGSATDFSTMRGKIVNTQSEHGFFVSQIDLGTVVHRGAHVTNLYEARLLNCFTTGDESWTQEIAFPTKQLTMLIHFPVARPPLLVGCFSVEGTVDKEITVAASILELFGKKAIVWQLEKPTFGGIYKLTWHW
jgi:hypothetical protein